MLLRPLRLFATLALLAAPLSTALIAPAMAQPASQDWAQRVTLTPTGSVLRGNPDAKTKLVEYFSYTCSHCADFAAQSEAPLRALIKSGAVSMEYRNYVRDGFDLTAALVARCGGVARFLGSHEAIFADYAPWIARAQSFSQANRDALSTKAEGEQFIKIADATGLTALAAKQGLSKAATHQCLADKDALATVLALRAGASDAVPNFEGTPTFLLNGKPVERIHSWPGLQPLLPALPTPTN